MKAAQWALASALLLVACSDERSVEQQIIGAITAMEEYGERGQRSDFMAMVHPQFSGQSQSMSRLDFRRFMVIQWNRHQRLQAQLMPIRVEPLTASAARANFHVLVTGGQGLIPERGQLYRVVTEWRRHDGAWRLYRADWEVAEWPAR